jgi:hypothetical protein
MVLLIILKLLAFWQSGAPPSTASIRGVVVDFENRPVAYATVFGVPDKDFRHQIRDTTASDGGFTLHNVPIGTIYIDAYKESAGYPYSFFSFFKIDDRPVEITVLEGQRNPDNVIIRLGAKAARLSIDVMDVMDQDDEHPIDGAQLRFSRDGMPGDYRRSARAKETLLIPAVSFRLTVEAAGYKPWHYAGERWRGREGLLVAQPDENRQADSSVSAAVNVRVHISEVGEPVLSHCVLTADGFVKEAWRPIYRAARPRRAAQSPTKTPTMRRRLSKCAKSYSRLRRI